MQRRVIQFLPAVQKSKLNHNAKPNNFAAELTNQLGGGVSRTSRRQNIIDNQHALSALN